MGLFSKIKNIFSKDNVVAENKQDENKLEEVKVQKQDETVKVYEKGLSKSRSGFVSSLINLFTNMPIWIFKISGVMGNTGQANYCASKAGVIGLTKSVAKELGSRGITSNAVAPGFIETEMTDVLSDDVKKSMGEQIPLKRFGQTKDIAETVAFLASDLAGYITGQVIQVDGGMAM